MANRPIFIPIIDPDRFVNVVDVEFEWYPGFSVVQKQKSISSLHKSASERGFNSILEISSKSPDELGVKLSAFNLQLETLSGQKVSVEAAYQGGKKFEEGGPYIDMYSLSGREIKKDERLTSSGELIGFKFNNLKWELEPKTAFYNWLYITALMENPELSEPLLGFDGFSDIEFNPKKSINCQARAAALYVSLKKQSLLSKAISSRENYLDIVGSILENPQQPELPGFPDS